MCSSQFVCMQGILQHAYGVIVMWSVIYLLTSVRQLHLRASIDERTSVSIANIITERDTHIICVCNFNSVCA